MSTSLCSDNVVSLGDYNLEQWLNWQSRLYEVPMELGLDRCRQVAERMGVLSPPFPVISVAGTNGKGSSVAMLESILHTAGYRVGSYTSPHLARYNERIKLQKQPLPDDRLCEAFLEVERNRGDTSLTLFEFGTLAALYIMHSSEVDVAVLEVGLGGRLDAVNVIDADLALITSIDYDHEQWLGRDRELIALEKGGIMRLGRPAVYADPRAVNSIQQQAKQIGSRLMVYGRDFSCARNEDGGWCWQGGGRTRDSLPLPHCHSNCQLYNASGVIMALDLLAAKLPVSNQDISTGLGDSYIPCRFMVMPSEPQIILDVAHNPQAMSELAQSIAKLPPRPGKTHFLVGALKGKNITGMLHDVMSLADSWHCVSISDRRGLEAADIEAALRQEEVSVPVQCYDDVITAMDSLRHSCDSNDRIVITGSFMVVGPAFARLAETRVGN